MKISSFELQEERLRMEFEKFHAGKYLNSGLLEGRRFWEEVRKKAGNKWWTFWKNKSDLEIIKEWYYSVRNKKSLEL